MVMKVVVSRLALELLEQMSQSKRKCVNSLPNINENAVPVSVLALVQKMLADEGNFVPRLVFDMVQK